MASTPISDVERRLRELVENGGTDPETAARQLICEGTGTRYVWTVAEDLYPDAFERSDTSL